MYNSKTGILASTGGSVPVYDPAGSGICSATYCHSNGAPAGQPVKYTNAAWGLAKGSIIGTAGECAACHGGVVGAFNNLSTNTHFRHVSSDPVTGFQYGCVICHSTVVSGNGTVSDTARHVNGVKEVGFSGPLATGTGWTGTTCSTSYCHSDGKGNFATPSWTGRASGTCGTCHAAAPALGGTLIASGAHFVHFSTSAASYGSMLTQANISACRACHPYASETAATHVDGTVNVDSSFGYMPAGSGTCTPCHKQTTSWTSGAVTCESCHTTPLSVIGGVTAQDINRAVTDGHGKYGQTCLACHATNQRHLKNSGGRLQPVMTTGLNSDCNYCHDDAAKVPTARYRGMKTHPATSGGGQTMVCNLCHDAHGTTNLAMIRTTINGRIITYTDPSGCIDTQTNQGLCQVCHTTTDFFKAGVAETQHPTTDCYTCHPHNATGGAFLPNVACDSCHGYPPAPRQVTSSVAFGTMNNWSSAAFEKYSGGGGAHLVPGMCRSRRSLLTVG